MAKLAGKLCAASAAAAGITLVLATAAPAAADFFNPFGGPWRPHYYYRDRGEPTKPPVRHHRRVRRHHEQKAERKHPAAKGPYQIVVSIAKQQVALYGRDGLIERAGISTGMQAHPTPMGVFSVISKARWHRSNIYSGAPMPYMQRITWSGIALHAGPRPGYPASHGCIRLPTDFAIRLFHTTKIGARVIVTREPVAPVEITSSKLFTPKPPEEKPVPVALASAETGKAAISLAAKSLAAKGPAAKGLAAKSADASKAISAATAALAASDAAPADTPAAVPSPMTGAIPLPPEAPGNMRKRLDGRPVSVFVSLKQKRVFVRQGFHALFDMPVTIADPDRPIGTHVYTAVGLTEDHKAMRWTAMSIPSSYRHHRHHRRHASRRHRHRNDEEASQRGLKSSTAAEALDRITLPPAAIDGISALLTPGSSLIVSDNALSDETDSSTNFIVLTR